MTERRRYSQDSHVIEVERQTKRESAARVLSHNGNFDLS